MPITELNGTSIRVGRAVKGWSQRELAQACGFTIYKVWSFENNVRQPKPEEWAQIWGALTSDKPSR